MNFGFTQPFVFLEEVAFPSRFAVFDDSDTVSNLILGAQKIILRMCIVITIDNAIFTANDINHLLDVPAQVIGGSTMIPHRAVLESADDFIS